MGVFVAFTISNILQSFSNRISKIIWNLSSLETSSIALFIAIYAAFDLGLAATVVQHAKYLLQACQSCELLQLQQLRPAAQ